MRQRAAHRHRLSLLTAGLFGLSLAVGTLPAAAQSTPASSSSASTPSAGTTSASTAALATSTSGKPTSLQETYEDWGVSCVQREDKQVCAMLQQQLEKERGQRVFAAEITSVTADLAEGTLLFPFGVSVSQPVKLKLDGADFGTPVAFRTCLAAGCLAPLNLDRAAMARLRSGSALSVEATVDGGKPVTFNLSLKGFGPALTRTEALLK
jgi:invasion protein IalB